LLPVPGQKWGIAVQRLCPMHLHTRNLQCVCHIICCIQPCCSVTPRHKRAKHQTDSRLGWLGITHSLCASRASMSTLAAVPAPALSAR
jgi:hypothetical protein